VSRRHQQNRRRSYGRRQHELRERRERLDLLAPEDRDPADPVVDVERSGVFVFLPPALRWAEGAA
jgi:hypothetical protein